MKKIKILFRTSGGRARGKQLGMGHIFRCINLAKNLKNANIFFLIEDFGSGRKTIYENGFKNCYKLKKNICLEEDIIETKKIINKKNIDITIIDKFDINQKLVREIRKESKVVIISDLEKINFASDLVINGFIGFKNEIKTNKFNTKCLIGPKFQILNENFARPPLNKNKKYDLLVTLGGFDEQNIIESILEILKNMDSKLKVKIILGPATIKNKQIRNLEKSLKFVKIIQKTKNMRNEIAETKFGICSGGITSYEFAAMKVPFGIISQVKHQTRTAKIWEKMNIATNFGTYSKKSQKKIERWIIENNLKENNLKENNLKENNLKENNVKQCIIDGKGVKRISDEMLKLI